MRESTKAYIAGLFDAEGLAGIYRSKDARHDGYCYKVVVKLSNTHKPVVEYLVSLFGGTFRAEIPKKGRKFYTWQIISQKSISYFLSVVYDYVTYKKPQVDLLLEYIQMNGARNPEMREDLYKRCMEYKQQECVTTNTLGTIQPKYLRPLLAGWFDGEGSVIIRRKKGKGWRIEATFANTYYDAVSAFAGMFGGAYYTFYTQTGKKCHRWRSTRSEVIKRFLLQITPYLRVKKEKAMLMLEYLETVHTDEDLRSDILRRSELLKIESGLIGNYESDPAVTQEAA